MSFLTSGTGLVWSNARFGEISSSVWIGGDFTVGFSFWVYGADITCSGLKFYGKWTGGASRSIKCSVVNQTLNTSLATTTVTAASGVVTAALFTNPVICQASFANKYNVCVYDLTGPGTYYCKAATLPTHNLTSNCPYYSNGSSFVFASGSIFSSGNSIPNGSTSYAPVSNEFYPIDPIFQ